MMSTSKEEPKPEDMLMRVIHVAQLLAKADEYREFPSASAVEPTSRVADSLSICTSKTQISCPEVNSGKVEN